MRRWSDRTPTYLGPSIEEVAFGLYEQWRDATERKMVRAIQFAGKSTPTWDGWPLDWEKEAIDCARVLMAEARRNGLYPTTARIEAAMEREQVRPQRRRGAA